MRRPERKVRPDGASGNAEGISLASPQWALRRIQQQAALGGGPDFWTTPFAGDVPPPRGIHRQLAAAEHVGLGDSEPATCFPPAVGLAQSWDPDLVSRVAAAIGREAQALDVQVVLGPGVNIKRDPRCGRNFEYYAEDLLVNAGFAMTRPLLMRGAFDGFDAPDGWRAPPSCIRYICGKAIVCSITIIAGQHDAVSHERRGAVGPVEGVEGRRA